MGIFNEYHTKRDLFYRLINEKHGLFGIAGPRKIGKTILLKQIAEYLNGKYYTYESSQINKNLVKEVTTSIVDSIHSDTTVICIDEIIEAPNEYLAKLFVELKSYSDRILIVFTGSYPEAVSSLSSRIGRGTLINMYSLTYNEYVRWYPNNDIIRYFKYSFTTEDTILDYVKSTLQAARDSWLSRTVLDDEENVKLSSLITDTNSYNELFTFIKACSFFRVYKNGVLDKIEYISEFKQADINENEYYKLKRYITTKRDYSKIFEFLENSYLGLPLYDVVLENNKFNLYYNSTYIGNMIFTMPWFLTVFNNKLNKNIVDIRLPHLLEYYTMLVLSENGYKVGKFRNDDYELDVIATPFDIFKDTIAVECKSGSKNNINRSKLTDYCIASDTGSIDRLYILNSVDDIDEVHSYIYNGIYKKRIIYFRKHTTFFKMLTENQYCDSRIVSDITDETSFFK